MPTSLDLNPQERIIVALDVNTLEEAGPLIRKLSPHVGCFKVGLQFMTAIGAPNVVKFVQSLGGQVFLDGKFDDIPNTVGEATKEAADLGVKMLNVHASAGIDAMKAAVDNKGDSLVLAVTVLTSLKDTDIQRIFGVSSKAKVLQFAQDALLAGVDGIICSPQELTILAEEPELSDQLKVTPGVRPDWAKTDDQKRVMTPFDAIEAGTDYLVIGRPITKPPENIPSPVEAAKLIVTEIKSALLQRS